jgi:hypothetical protein
MKKFESLGKSLGREEQKQITGGGSFELKCRNLFGGTVTIGSYPDSATCDTALADYCYNPPYNACFCSDDPSDTTCV